MEEPFFMRDQFSLRRYSESADTAKQLPQMQFTLRDLLLLTVIVGLAVGWASDRRSLMAKLEPFQTAQAIESREDYPPGWESLLLAVANERAILKDRIQILTAELVRLGYTVEIGNDGLHVKSPPPQSTP
jgi:hypothetical protein